MFSRYATKALLAIALPAGLLPAAAHADVITVYTDYNAFTAALNSFDTFSPAAPFGPGPNGFGGTVTDGSGFGGATAVPSAPYGGVSTNDPSDTLALSFTGTPNAVGGYFYPNDEFSNLTPGSINVTVNGQSFTVTTTGTDPSSVPFYGFVDTTGPITSITDSSDDDTSYFPTVGEIVVGSASVPEPTTLACGLVAFMFMRRRNRD